jgi:hypothetical protein
MKYQRPSVKGFVRKATWEPEDNPSAGEDWKGGQMSPQDPLQPEALLSTLAMQDSNLNKIDALLKDLDPETVKKVKSDIVTHIAKDFEDEHEQAQEALGKPPINKDTWEQLWDAWVQSNDVIKGTSFEKLAKQHMANQFKTHHEEISEPMPGEVPSSDELEQWFKASKLEIKKLANLIEKKGFKVEAESLRRLIK